jgi:hypothetical protein
VGACPKTLHDIPDAGLAERVAEREWLEPCSGLERALIVRWLAARDVIEWLLADPQCAAGVAGLGGDEPRPAGGQPVERIPRRWASQQYRKRQKWRHLAIPLETKRKLEKQNGATRAP